MEPPSSALPRGTVTFLFSDIEGSTDLARRLRAEYGRVRSGYRRLMRDVFDRHGGHELDTAGDGFFVAFERAGDAVTAAIAAQRSLVEFRNGEDPPLRVRIGLHSAEPYLDEEGYTGVGVHRAERICAAGHGRQILLSNATAGIVEDIAIESVDLQDLGEHRLKDIERPQRLFQVVVDGLEAQFPPLKSLDTPAPSAVLTLLVADLVGWSAVLTELGDERALALARVYQALAVREIKRYGGRALELVSDNVVAAFDRPLDAIRAAHALREALREEPWFAAGEPPEARMAVHSGRVTDPRGGQLGSTGYRCMLLCKIAAPGQVVVSHATEALLEGEPSEIRLRDLGEKTLQRLDRPARVFEIV